MNLTSLHASYCAVYFKKQIPRKLFVSSLQVKSILRAQMFWHCNGYMCMHEFAWVRELLRGQKWGKGSSWAYGNHPFSSCFLLLPAWNGWWVLFIGIRKAHSVASHVCLHPRCHSLYLWTFSILVSRMGSSSSHFLCRHVSFSYRASLTPKFCREGRHEQ